MTRRLSHYILVRKSDALTFCVNQHTGERLFDTPNGCPLVPVVYAETSVSDTGIEKFIPVYNLGRKKKPKDHDFAWALKQAKDGCWVRRRCWNGRYKIRFSVGGLQDESGRTPEIYGEQLLATDWELAE